MRCVPDPSRRLSSRAIRSESDPSTLRDPQAGAVGARLAVGIAIAFALAMALAPSSRCAPVVGAGFAFADSCDTCSVQNNPPIPDHEPGGPHP